MLRRVGISLLVLAVLLVGADRAAAVVAGRTAAGAVQRSEGLAERPEVRFRGFPFLTQAVSGRFREVEVDVRGYRRQALTVSRIEAELRGLRLSLSDALSGDVEAARVDQGQATVTLDYDDLNSYLRTRRGGLSVRGQTGVLTVSGSVQVPRLGAVPLSGDARVDVAGDAIVATVTRVRSVGPISIPEAVGVRYAGRLSFTVPTGRLPFDITLRSVGIGDEGLRVSADARGVVIRPGGPAR